MYAYISHGFRETDRDRQPETQGWREKETMREQEVGRRMGS